MDLSTTQYLHLFYLSLLVAIMRIIYYYLLKTSRFKTMIANKNKTDKFGYEYFEKKILGKGAYGVVWLC